MQEALLARLRRRLKGKQGLVARSLGVSPETVRRWLSGERPLYLSRLCDLLHAVGDEPQAWLHMATSPTPVYELLGPSRWQRPPKCMLRIGSAARLVGEEGGRTPEKEILPAGESSPEAVAVFLRQRNKSRNRWLAELRDPALLGKVLDELELYRHENPKDATTLGFLALETAAQLRQPEALIQALGVVGSCYRSTGSLAKAAAIYRRAIRLSEEYLLLSALARTYRRAAYVLRDRYDSRALAVAEEAGILFSRFGDLDSYARTLVDRGSFLMVFERFEEGISLLSSAIPILPTEARMDRLAAHFALSTAYQSLGRHHAAAEHFCLAEALLDRDQTYARGCLLRNQGDALLAAGDLGSAVQVYREVRQLWRDFNPFSAALASLDLVTALHRGGHHAEAAAEARSLAGLLEPLKAETAVVACLADLVTMASRLTLVRIEGAKSVLQRASPSQAGPSTQ